MITLTVAGQMLPLKQATLRRSVDASELSLQIVGPHALAVDAAVSMAVSGGPTITGTISESTSGERITSATVEVAAAVGSSAYSPTQVQFLSTGTVRGDLDFAIKPGDTYNGIKIAEVTHTIGTESAAFTEVRF